MLDLKNILVPTDFSDSSLRALEFGQCMAKQHNSLIHLLHIIEPDYVIKAPHGYESVARYRRVRILEAEEDLRRFVAKINTASTNITEAILEGYASEKILLYAMSNKIDLILLATNGSGKAFRQPMGKVADRILRSSKVPVILVKANVPVFAVDKVFYDNARAENWVG